MAADDSNSLPKMVTSYGTFKLGKKPYPPGTREQWIAEGRVLARAPDGYFKQNKMLKSAVNNSGILPPIGDQGNEGSCVYWAGTYYTKTASMKRNDPSLNITAASNQCSPRFTYNLTNDGVDDGGYGHEPFEIFMRYGVASLQQAPYTATQYANLPVVADFIEGLHRRSTNYVWLWQWKPSLSNITELKTLLDAGGVAACAIEADASFANWTEGSAPWVGPSCLYTNLNHMVTVCGYDSNSYLVANSWGTSWGSNGFIYINADYFTNYVGELMYPLEPPAYPPATNYATFKITHARRSDIQSLAFSVNGMTVWSNSPLPKNMPSGTGSFNTDNRANWELAVDLTPAAWGPANSVTAACMDNVSGLSGSISNFELYFNGSLYVSTNTPVAIPDNTGVPASVRVLTFTPYEQQTITFATIPDQLTTNSVRLFATASSGLLVSFSVLNGPAMLAGGTNITFTGAGCVSVVASQSGDINWLAAADVTNTFLVTKAGAYIPPGMVLIPAGNNSGTDPDFGAYSLTVSTFYMDSTLVTKPKWDEVYTWALTNGYSFTNAGSVKATNHPVQTVNWHDCAKWCNARSEKEGRPVSYRVGGNVYRIGQDNTVTCATNVAGYRLPTDVEFHYAARGGLSGKRFPWGDTIDHTKANYYGNPSGYAYDTGYEGNDTHFNTTGYPYTSPVDTFAANGYGLYDMAGNLWEWCTDWSPGYEGSYRVARGGGWNDDGGAYYCQVGDRNYDFPDRAIYAIGFRTVLLASMDPSSLLFTPATPQVYNTTNTLSVSGGNGTGAVSFAVISGVGEIVSSNRLRATAGTGNIVLQAVKAEDALYFAQSAVATVTVTRALDTITFSATNQVYDGSAKPVTALAGSGSSVALTYGSSPSAPINVGGYAVVGVVNAANWQATNTTWLTIAASDPVITNAVPTERYVSPSGTESGGYTNWATAAKTIQKAVNACTDGDTVWVTNGTYYVTNQVSLTKGVTLSSANGVETTIIDGGGATRCAYLSNSNAVIDGFTIQNGSILSESGGGVACEAGTVQNCTIVSNVASSGGGVYCGAGARVLNCQINWNDVAPADGFGGGVDCTGILDGCLIAHNNGRTDGGGVYGHPGSSIRNCSIIKNLASRGSGVFSAGGVTVQGTILYLNTGSNWWSYGSSNAFNYCCTSPNPDGTGNITNDPMFVDAPLDNYRLSTNSPCIDAGVNQAWMLGASDMAGTPRIANGTVDLGAYEFTFYIGTPYSAIDITWDSEPALTYQVQACTNLLTHNWTNFGTSVTATGAFTYAYDWIRGIRCKYYKVLQGASAPLFTAGIRYSAVDVTWSSISGATYQVQSCTNLLTPDWLNVGSPVTATGSSCYMPDWIRDGNDKYYRVVTNAAHSGMVLIPAGNNSGTDPDFGAYNLTVSAFYMDSTLVTKAQWDTVYTWAITNGYSFANAGSGKAANHPVHTVSWHDCAKWCNARSEKEGRPVSYRVAGNVYRGADDNSVTCATNVAGYRLPTDVEFHYAARGGLSNKRFPWGDTIDHTKANYYGLPSSYTYDNGYYGYDTRFNTGDYPYTSPVDTFAANGYGLYDMAGNLWEWCTDWHPGYEGSYRVDRGGSWDRNASYCQVGLRAYGYPDYAYNIFGFRAVLPPCQ